MLNIPPGPVAYPTESTGAPFTLMYPTLRNGLYFAANGTGGVIRSVAVTPPSVVFSSEHDHVTVLPTNVYRFSVTLPEVTVHALSATKLPALYGTTCHSPTATPRPLSYSAL